MKRFISCLIFLILLMYHVSASGEKGDTVIIELNNSTKIIIYTEDRASLEKLQQYDLNKVLRELNTHLKSASDEHTLKDKTSPGDTIIYGDGVKDYTRVHIGNMELLISADDWEDLEDDWNDDLYVKKYKYTEDSIDRTRNYFNLDIGMNNWMDHGRFPDANGLPYSVKPWGSWYIALNSVNKTWISGPLFLEWGGGVSWYNWKMQNADVRIEQGADRIEFNKQTLYNGTKSKLSVPYINLSLIPVIDFSHGLRRVNNLERGNIKFRTYKKRGIRFGVGPYIGYRVGAHTKFVYKDDNDEKHKSKDRDNFYLTNFRYGLRGQIGYKGLDLFVMYDLNRVFSTGRGPDGSNNLNAITFGITL